jgi:very-short-patch-repair endonuclease
VTGQTERILVIEVDGGYHAARAVGDARRDRKLARVGYLVLRLDADLIRRDVQAAVAQVRAELGLRKTEE